MVVSIWSVLPSVRLHTSAEVIVIDSPFLDMVLVVFIVSFFPSDDHVAKDLLSPMREVLILSLPSRVYFEVVVLSVPSGPVMVLATVRRLPSWVTVKSPPPKPPPPGPPGRCPCP